MDISEAKQQVKTTVEAYLKTDKSGMPRIPIAEQRPIFLLGAPGVGKTAIMGQVADELGIGLVAYSMTHHTRQSALGLPFIVNRSYRGGKSFDVSEYTMSEIIASMYDYMEETGYDKGILFLDEINCVSETLYPSMLQFLQFKTFGRHSIPDGWIVVCAGNPPEYNKSVHEFDIVTLDRLRKIEIEPSYEAWRDYARTQHVHPAVTTYLEIEPSDFYLVESTPEGKRFVSARGWFELSGYMTLLEEMGEPVDQKVIAQFLQHPEIAERFSVYYELFDKYRSDYQVESILAGEAADEIMARASQAAFDERLALISLMLDRLGGDMLAVLERKTALGMARDVVRGSEEPLSQEATVDEVLRGRAKRLEADALAAERRRSGARKVMTSQMATASLLRAYAANAESQGHDYGEQAYAAVAEAYRVDVADLAQAGEEVSGRLDNAFSFIAECFGEGREMLVFTTELTARKHCSQFIIAFGNENYDAQSARMATDTLRDAIMNEIDEIAEAVRSQRQ